MKSTFVMRVNYDDIFQQLPAGQAGEVIQAIYAYVNHRQPAALSTPAAQIAFACIQKDIAYDLEKYQQLCEKRAQNGRKGGRPPKTKKSNCLASENKHPKSNAKPDEDEEMSRDEKSRDDKYLLTAQAGAAQGVSNFSGGKETATANTLAATGNTDNTPTPQTPLQAFADEVAKNFESHIHTDEQKQIWFKRNVRCLRDIFNFCSQDTPLALETIGVCVARLAKAGLTGGYEAVCRNLPEYCAKAEQQLREKGYEPGAG